MGTVRVENYYYPEGELFSIPGLGGVKNFEETTVDEVQIETYKSMTGAEWPDNDYLLIVSQEPPPAPEPEEAEAPPVEDVTEEPQELVYHAMPGYEDQQP